MLKVKIALCKETDFFILKKHDEIELIIDESELGSVMKKVDALAAAIYGKNENGIIKANTNHMRSNKVKNAHWASYLGNSNWLGSITGGYVFWSIDVTVEWFHYQIKTSEIGTGKVSYSIPMNSIKSAKKINRVRRHLEMNGYTTHGNSDRFIAVKDGNPTLEITRDAIAMLYNREKKAA